MRKTKITTIILAIILITLVAFGGVYIKTQNRMENKVKDYQLGRELSGGRVIELKVKTENSETENSETEAEEEITETEDFTEKYETVKTTIEKRLDNLGAQDYTTSLNQDNGTIVVELAEDDNTDTYAYFLTATGKVQIKEKDSENELLSDEMVKKALYSYSSDSDGAYQVYLELQLTKEGQAKINEIQNNYAIFENEVEEIEEKEEADESEDENAEEAENTETETENEENVEETKKIAVLTIAGTEYKVNKIEKNKIRVKIGTSATNSTSINNNISKAAELAILINSGKYPVDYEISENRFIYPDITEKQIQYMAIAIIILLIIAFVVFTVKYKINGLLASIAFIGFTAILSLILRYTGVIITIEGIGAIIVTFIINLLINKSILLKIKEGKQVNETIKETYKEKFLQLVPIIIMILVFSFSGWTNLSSFGLVMFWGLVLIAVYNAVITKSLLKLKEDK